MAKQEMFFTTYLNGYLYKFKLRRDTALFEKFYRLHIKHMPHSKISLKPCFA